MKRVGFLLKVRADKLDEYKIISWIWINIRILFIATARNDLMFGSVSVDLQSLKGDRVITRT